MNTDLAANLPIVDDGRPEKRGPEEPKPSTSGGDPPLCGLRSGPDAPILF